MTEMTWDTFYSTLKADFPNKTFHSINIKFREDGVIERFILVTNDSAIAFAGDTTTSSSGEIVFKWNAFLPIAIKEAPTEDEVTQLNSKIRLLDALITELAKQNNS